MNPLDFLDYSPEVQQAFFNKQPLVALESTIITHGMEYPMNKETAESVEGIIRSNGAIPATIAIIKGRIKVGLTAEELEYTSREAKLFKKCSRRDIASVLVNGGNGSTTVAATMFLANLAGLKLFVTGGIGGVHRGAETTFDISADLTELGRTPIAVVSAGAKVGFFRERFVNGFFSRFWIFRRLWSFWKHKEWRLWGLKQTLFQSFSFPTAATRYLSVWIPRNNVPCSFKPHLTSLK